MFGFADSDDDGQGISAYQESEPVVTPVIHHEAGEWVIVLRGRVPDPHTGSGAQFEFCWTREGWAAGSGRALKFETAQSARRFLSRNLHLLRSTTPPADPEPSPPSSTRLHQDG